MGDGTGIEWTDATWNPIRGCSLVSKGCQNCYAMGVAARFSGPGQAYEGLASRRSNGKPQWTGEVRVVDAHMHDPLKWKRPRRIFVNSMSDLFHENVSDDTIAKVVAVMALAPRHTFQLLTKRPARMKALWNSHVFRQLVAVNIRLTAVVRDLGVTWPEVRDDNEWPLKNLWLGVSTEDQPTADERIPELEETPAAVRFISAEPLLGPIVLRKWRCACGMVRTESQFVADNVCPKCKLVEGQLWSRFTLDWVIAGGESGLNARPMHPAWPRSLKNQCQSGGVAFFFKQWGEWVPTTHLAPSPSPRFECLREDGHKQWLPSFPGYAVLERVGKKRAGRQLGGVEWNEFPLEVAHGR